jgi:acyl-coenzyme A thioesterase PaaI-like protein
VPDLLQQAALASPSLLQDFAWVLVQVEAGAAVAEAEAEPEQDLCSADLLHAGALVSVLVAVASCVVAAV